MNSQAFPCAPEAVAGLFPQLAREPACPIDLEAESHWWRLERPQLFDNAKVNPLVDPKHCQQMVDAAHRRLGVAWSYGGYLEVRGNLWRGSYLDETGKYLHLGVDCNAPCGTKVGAPCDATVVFVDDDPDQDGGWGQRIFLRPKRGIASSVLFILAHLQNVAVQAGMQVTRKAILAEVGGPPDNGNWHEHLHVQAILVDLFHEILVERFHELDGYGHPRDAEALKRDYPDPLPLLADGASC